MVSIFQKLSTHSKNALKTAFSLALASGQKSVEPAHLLYGLAAEKGSIASQVIAKTKIEPEKIKNLILNGSTSQAKITGLELTTSLKKALEKSFLIASTNQHRYIGTEHLLASLLNLKDETLTKIFDQGKLNLDEIQNQINSILNSTSKFPDLADGLDYLGENAKYSDNFSPLSQASTKNVFSLDLFATELTNPVIQKNIDPVIGRQEEINRLIQILSRRNKNNPLLLGDPGVGKTAIVEGLAKKIMTGDVPEVLLGKKVYTLDLSLILAGTSFRGEFENRLKQIINDVKQNQNIILFIDEIHNLIGAGSATGSMDAANILKPALARGEIRCIGATTPTDFKKHIESDPALERRFQPIYVSQPSVEKTIKILEGIKNNYEIFHQVKIESSAIKAAAELSERYLTDRFLPDKAIDLIDEAASAVKVKSGFSPLFKQIKNLEEKLTEYRTKKEEAVINEKFTAALNYQAQEQKTIEQIKNLQLSESQNKHRSLPKITEKNIAQIVSKITEIPLTEILATEKTRLLNLEKILSQKISGQNQALKTIAAFIRRARTGISAANRPIGSFIFLGPSGVGKTELARVLAETVFGNPQALVKIDMSEFAEGFNISKLIGAPAGYVGYKEGTRLTDAVKQRPYSVVLFDEIEKAHPQIFNLLLQVLEDGYLTDGTGKKIDFRNTIIIMTSNLGSASFNQQAKLGFQATSEKTKNQIEQNLAEIESEVIKTLKDKFPPELLSRIDKTVVFNPLSHSNLIQITKWQIAELTKRLNKKGIMVKFDSASIRLIAKISYSPQTGARAIRQTIQELIESKIANKILANSKKQKNTITIKAKNNEIIIL